MTDEAAAPEGQPATPETPPVNVLNADGTLAENWHTQAPEGYEDLRESKSLPRSKTIWNLARSNVEANRKIGLGFEHIPRPSDSYSDDDWNEWHKAGGRPETAQDYQMAKPKEWPEGVPWNEEAIGGYQELFHKIGLSSKQVGALFDYNNSLSLQMHETSETEKDIAHQAVGDGLHRLWGAAYDQNVHRGNLAMSKDKDAEKDPEYHERLVEKINKDPDLIRFASNMGAKFIEDKLIEDPGIPTPTDLEEQIQKIMNDPKYTSDISSVRKPLIEKVLALRQQQIKNRKTG